MVIIESHEYRSNFGADPTNHKVRKLRHLKVVSHQADATLGRSGKLKVDIFQMETHGDQTLVPSSTWNDGCFR